MDELPPCPECGAALRLVMRLEATSGLLGGSQLKVPVREWPHLVCDACGFDERGELDG